MDGFAVRAADTERRRGPRRGRPRRRGKPCGCCALGRAGDGDLHGRRGAGGSRRGRAARARRRARRTDRAERSCLARRQRQRAVVATSSAGQEVLGPGAKLGAAQVGALAAAGIGEVRCTKRPRVGILVTGSELRSPGEPLEPGQIYESNGLMLAAQLSSAGAVPAQLGSRGRQRGRASSGDGTSAARLRHARDERGRLGRAARSRSARAGGAAGRGGLLGRVDEAGPARRVRRAPRPPRLQPSGQPGVGARLLRAARAARGRSCCSALPTHSLPSWPESSPATCPGTPSGTSTCAAAGTGTARTGSCARAAAIVRSHT